MFAIWRPDSPVLVYIQLCVGLLLILVGAYVIYRVHRGSQSRFVYTLMLFTILDGVAQIGQAVSYSLILIGNGNT
jgi:hypothetical protein